MRRVAGIFLTVLCLAPAAAHADAQFTAEDIIQHFMKGKAATKAARPSASEVSRPVVRQNDDDEEMVLPLTGAKRGVTLGGAPGGGELDLLITFESGSDRLTTQAMRNLDAFAAALNSPALVTFVFEVQGHTDAAGSDQSNMALSQRRAESVVTYLVDRGVAGKRLRARGYGEAHPLMDDPNHPHNRRVVARRLR